MFHLGGSTFPTTREELAAAITEGLSRLLTLSDERETVRIEGGEYPFFERMSLDLTGARADGDRIPPEPRGIGKTQPAFSSKTLQVDGHPLYARSAAVNLSLAATDARFNYDQDAEGRRVLLLAEAKNGQIAIQVSKRDLDALLLAGAKEGAARQGVQIQETHLVLAQIDSRAVGIDIRVKAKKLFISAIINVRGKLKIDDSLNARLTDLSCTGEGMLGDMASNFIRPKLQEVEGKDFALTALSLGQVRLRDLHLEVGETLKVSAKFGS